MKAIPILSNLSVQSCRSCRINNSIDRKLALKLGLLCATSLNQNCLLEHTENVMYIIFLFSLSLLLLRESFKSVLSS